MKHDHIPINTTFKYVPIKFDGVLGDIAGRLEAANVYIVPTSSSVKYQYVAVHEILGLIFGVIQSTNGVILIDPRTRRKYEISQFNEFYDCEEHTVLCSIDTLTNNINLSLDKVNTNIRDMVKLINFLILKHGLDLYVSSISLECDKLVIFESTGNKLNKLITVRCDELLDGNESLINSQIDVLVYLGIK